MSSPTRTALIRFARDLGVVVLTACAAWIASPAALAVIGTQGAVLAVGIAVPVILAVIKYLKTANGETAGDSRS